MPGLSITALTRKSKASEKHSSPAAPNAAAEFTKEQLIAFWNQYKNTLEQAGNFMAASALKFSDSLLVEKNNITYKVPNELMKRQIKNVLPGLMQFLRQQLHNHTIDIKIEIDAELLGEIDTQDNLFKKMNEKNENLSLLAQEFDLIFLN